MNLKRRFFALVLPIVSAGVCLAQWNPLNPVTGMQRQPGGVLITLKSGVLKLQVCSESIVRVLYSPSQAIPEQRQYVVIKDQWPPVNWTVAEDAKEISLSTAKLKITVLREDSSIHFADSSGKQIFEESQRRMVPVTVNGESTYHAEIFEKLWGSYEAFYGLGQHQAGVWNYRGESVELSQENTNISIPLYVSTYGYGIFWNNTSRSRFNNRFLNALYLSSEVADVIDYYFIYGPEFDQIIAGYRELTGAPPLFGKWAYGYWQCKNRYQSQDEILGVAHKYRELHIPLDNIVQDWFWWNTMGEPVFNDKYPDPKGMIDDLHKNNVHIMFSFWPFFRKGSPVYDDMDARGYFIAKTVAPSFHPVDQALYDAFNPEARKYYWDLLNTGLFKIGADAWWMDTTEPETEGRETNILVENQVALGSGARYANLFPLMTTAGVYEGQRATSDQKRVFILSRSAFAGSQRNAAAVWSGDINPTWSYFKKQIPAGLNYSLSGLPYWTTDIGGFVSGNPDDPAYRELYIRWFEFGTFNPILRAHGTRTTNQNELWSYGPEAQKILVNYDSLRYRLLPYIYSLAWRTTSEAYTPMRGLVMDFRNDERVSDIGDQFMFGPALLVSPVTDPGSTTRRMYLPQATWYDFWTGRSSSGGKVIDTPSPLEQIPLYVRAGSILPLGPEMEWATQKAEDPIELRVYRGANGSFTLYEDENDTYNYEKGAYASIPIHWDDGKQTLTIGDRKGQFPGMLTSRTFQIVWVGDKHGAGIGHESKPDKIVQYSGKQIEVKR
ncbi:MAG TPA: glycoside hydrolase family 31 protein [Terriglobales bacterium]